MKTKIKNFFYKMRFHFFFEDFPNASSTHADARRTAECRCSTPPRRREREPDARRCDR